MKALSRDEAPADPESTTENAAAETQLATDPTIANAGLTELQDAPVSASVEPSQAVQANEPVSAPTQTSAGDGANLLTENSWEPQASGTLNGDEWVEVPHPAEAEGESPSNAAPAQSTSWAEDVPTGAAPAEGDGFEQVVHHHQRQGSVRGRGGRGGRGRGDASRGRGGRGEFRGRGRGGAGGGAGGRGGERGGEFRGGRGRGGPGGQQGNRREAVATN